MAEVRAQSGVPVAAQFAGLGAPTPCAPVVIDSTTGFAYSMTASGTVVPFGIGGGVRSVSAPNGVLAVTTSSGAVALGWSGVTAGSIIAATSGTAMGVISAAASGNVLLSNGTSGGMPEWGKADLTLYVSGRLPFANLTQISGMSVLGVAGSATGDVAGIRGASDYQVLRVAGSGISFGAVNVSATAAVSGILAVVNGGSSTGTATGTGVAVLGTSPSLTTPTIGAASATSLTFTSTSGIIGTTTNDSAASGSVGQYTESVVGPVASPATTVWGDLTSISLGAGDWDVTAISLISANGATVTACEIGISTTSGNSSAGLTVGSNRVSGPIPLDGVRNASAAVAAYRMSLGSTTTVYFKMNNTFTVATPNMFGRLSARRVR